MIRIEPEFVVAIGAAILLAYVGRALFHHVRTKAHRHEYEVMGQFQIFDGGKLPVAHRYVMRCKVCGDITRRQV